MIAPRLLASCLLLPLLGACSHMQNVGESPAPAAPGNGVAVPTAQREAVSPRAQRGDTVSLHYQVLQRFLPEHVAGFVREGSPQGESVQLGGISYSTCEQHYRKGSQRLKVQLVDYNGAQALYAGATALMSPNIWQESDEQLMRGCDLGLPGVRGYETVQKLERRAAVALGVGDRFFVSVESTGQEDTRLVKAVARTLNLRGLAAL
ncbi:hypothetical protein LJ737_22190 [Hymenobacter sp. 15J16-1T3B]|uniref:hypothetical protein n=1 Tax=Hymenobacter sp. 15J16-1T3B TaxID=2886941 RepID=UPI001D0F5798|nr:hypothetical protein [Hymenobacter sp. 15J16-1T3B]MCC3159964.1 hypothetical protein [Hymenobacter sp. 15J16-1T3B]